MLKNLSGSILLSLLVAVVLLACKDDFFEKPPYGAASEYTLRTRRGVDVLLIGAYSALDGFVGWEFGSPWNSAASNWVYGNVASDDAYTGSGVDCYNEIMSVEQYMVVPYNDAVRAKWGVVYEGAARANTVLRILAETPESEVAEPDRSRIAAEARFLRGHYHFEAKKMWNNVPYIHENELDGRVPNDRDIWPDIEADFRFAFENLPETQAEVGRANKWAAAAFLAKALVFQQKYAEAKPLLEDIIANGVTVRGEKYGLNDCFHDNFNAETKNSKESVFAVQYSVNDGSTDNENGGYGDILNFPYSGGPSGCCGYHQPSQNLVNAFKTDADGLPLLDDFNAEDVTHDEGIPSDSAFTEYAGALDPRLDWTAGRRGIPYLDWGDHPGRAWIRDQDYSGPYAPKKNVFYKRQEGTLSAATGWIRSANANNYTFIRFADVLLWAAECEVELGNLGKALEYVNLVRDRAKNGCVVKNDDGSPAANYHVELYTNFPSQEYARKAVRFERRLELALEGHRFFDLVRWGIAEETIDDYLAGESDNRHYLSWAHFEAHEVYFPISYWVIEASMKDGAATLKQNEGY